MFTLTPYDSSLSAAWDDFVRRSKNGTFLLERGYMDYHSDRFRDHSFLFFFDEKLYAVLPACTDGDTLYSHRGLTYGGLIVGDDTTAAHVMEVFSLLNATLRAEGIKRVVYKPSPYIYHRLPSDEDLYAIHRHGRYRLAERDLSSAIAIQQPAKWRQGRMEGVRRANREGIAVRASDDFAAFWQILESNLMARHGVRPVHSLQEIMLLHSRFPHNIRLFAAYQSDVMVAGVVVYANRSTLHTQYISASEAGKRVGAVDAIIYHLLREAYTGMDYLDFGKSTESDSCTLNESLLFQKEGFGARAVCYDTYEWQP